MKKNYCLEVVEYRCKKGGYEHFGTRACRFYKEFKPTARMFKCACCEHECDGYCGSTQAIKAARARRRKP